MTREDLKPFCISTDWGRVELEEPFSHGLFSYATNGHILIRVPRLADVTSEKGPTSDDLFVRAQSPAEWIDVPDPGPALFDRCDCCGGQPGGCDECDWTGRFEPFTPVRVGDQFFQAKYLRLLRTLPGVKIGPTFEMYAARFQFDGGDGLIMPCKDRQS
jgi:hypothetical protein